MTIEGDIKNDASGKPTHVFLGEEWRALPKTVEEQLSEAKAEIERLRAALESIAWHRNETGGKIARAALAQEKHNVL